MDPSFSILPLLGSVLGAAAPLILIAEGETICEKSGVINLSLDGSVLLAAMSAFVAAQQSNSLIVGFLAGGFTGMLTGLVIVLFSIHLRLAQVAVGFALSLMCRDLAYFLGNPYSRTQGPQMLAFQLPFTDRLSPELATLFHQPLIVYFALLLVLLLWWFFSFTRTGLIVKAVGENPAAAFARGINPLLVRVAAVLTGSFLVGLGGAAFSLCIKPGWGRPQGAEGIGWIGLALVIFGGWNPVRVFVGSLLFAFLQVSGISLQNIFPAIPAQVFQTAPFPLMIFALVFMHYSGKKPAEKSGKSFSSGTFLRLIFSGRSPQALGENYRQD
ncbi:MAG: ABC transporter permease [Thermodesulfobacteriota bacterium]